MSKYGKKDYGTSKGQKSEDSQREPEWFKSRVRRTRVSNDNETEPGHVPSKRTVQSRGSDNERKSNSSKGNGQRSSGGTGVQVRRPKGRPTVRKQKANTNKAIGFSKQEVTLQELRKSLDDEILKSLLNDTYNPHQIVSIKYKMKGLSKVAEDALRGPMTRKRIRNVKKPRQHPTIKYGELYNRFTNGEVALDAYVILGRYLTLYKREYGENDPEFADMSISSAIFSINEMASLLTNGDFKKILEYVDKIMPLWAEQLRKGASFPNGRPTFKTFFIKRGIWSQRYSLVRRWK